MYKPEIGKLIFDWYQENKRDFPWRRLKNPYFIWLSEVILQQTQAHQGLPYFERMVKRFPDIEQLARAREEEVLSYWQGLGYYSRARNLHKTAKIIVQEKQGEFPQSYSKLIKLPGVGKYTASAISSIAFNEKQAVVDGNVYRVISRLFAEPTCIDLTKAYAVFHQLASNLMGDLPPGDFNQAIMELGATVCKPKNPTCDLCPVNSDCLAKKNNLIDLLPKRCKKVTIKPLYFNYLVIENKLGELALNQRSDKNIWANMYEFPLIESKQAIGNLSKLGLKEKYGKELDYIGHYEEAVHLLSHRKIYAKFWNFRLNKEESPTLKFYDAKEIRNLPKPKLIVNFLKQFYSKN